MKNLLLTIGLTLLTLPLSATELAELDFIGFSKEGKQLAFQQTWINEGSGAAEAKMVFIEVAKNEYAAKPIETLAPSERETLQEVREENLKKSQPILEKLEIYSENKGQLVISRPFTDVGANPHEVKFSIGVPLPNMPHTLYTLKLTEEKGDADCFGFAESKMFTLTLQKEGEEKNIVLQADRSVPKTRGCVFAYRIQDVYVYENKELVVFLNMIVPSAEGQSLRFLGVTGVLP